jgi:hypothetical protein
LLTLPGTFLKQFLGSTRNDSKEEVKKTVKGWFSGLASDFYDAVIQKLSTIQQMPETSRGLCKQVI